MLICRVSSRQFFFLFFKFSNKHLDNIFDVIPQVHKYIETVGLAMCDDQRLKFANSCDPKNMFLFNHN